MDNTVLNMFISLFGGIDKTAEAAGMKAERLKRCLSGAEFKLSEMQRLCHALSIPGYCLEAAFAREEPAEVLGESPKELKRLIEAQAQLMQKQKKIIDNQQQLLNDMAAAFADFQCTIQPPRITETGQI